MTSRFASMLLVACVLAGARPALSKRVEVDLSNDLELEEEFQAISSEKIQVNTSSEGEASEREGSTAATSCSDEQCSKCCCIDTSENYKDQTSDDVVSTPIAVAAPGNTKENQECKGTSYGLFTRGKCYSDCEKCSAKTMQQCKTQSPPEDICCRVVKPGGEHWTVMYFPWYISRGDDCATHTGHIIAEDLCLTACKKLKVNRGMSKNFKLTFRTKRDFGSKYALFCSGNNDVQAGRNKLQV